MLAVGGCTFITGLVSGGVGEVSISWQAILSGLGSGLGYGLYSIFGRVAVKKYSELTVTFYTFVIASLSLLPFCHIGKIAAVASASGFAVLHSLLLGLVSTLAPFLLYTTGLSHMETGKAAVLTFSEPVMATIISITVFGEVFTRNHAIGMIAIVTSIVLLNINFTRRQNH